jgi:hypothetical protein
LRLIRHCGPCDKNLFVYCRDSHACSLLSLPSSVSSAAAGHLDVFICLSAHSQAVAVLVPVLRKFRRQSSPDRSPAAASLLCNPKTISARLGERAFSRRAYIDGLRTSA